MSLHQRSDKLRVLGLDIGGANLKAATSDGRALSVPFALWREPQNLAKRLHSIVRQFAPDRLWVTMTGELCDCFATKREGVGAILDAVADAAPKIPALIWSTQGKFVSAEDARSQPLQVAAANWHALATFAGRFAPKGATVLIDVGSTTTDIIPLWQGKPVPRGLTDPERLASHELVYTGVRRTPVCAVLPGGVARELFATMLDVYLVLKKIPEEPENLDTADRRPATCAAAHARLARMMCDDQEHFSWAAAVRLARAAYHRQVDEVARAVQIVAKRLPVAPQRAILSGAGDFLTRAALKALAINQPWRVVRLQKKLSAAVSATACAYALAVLAESDIPSAENSIASAVGMRVE